MDENKSDWKFTVPPVAQLLHGVGDGPFESVTECLCFVLENRGVWPSFCTFDPPYGNSSEQM